MIQLNTLKQRTHSLNTQIYTYYLSFQDKRVQWYVKLLVVLAIGYALSPIDLIPDLVPVFGFLDDVVLVSLGFHFSYQLLTRNIIGQAKLKAVQVMHSRSTDAARANRVVHLVWLLMISVTVLLVYKLAHISFM